jgi:type II secretory pathway pseudopilin PulG
MLVTLTILAIVSGGGLVAYSKLRDRRSVAGDASNVVEFLRLAQRRALAGDKPAECGSYQLDGYTVVVDVDSLSSRANCGPAETPVANLMISASEIDTGMTINFKTLSGAANGGDIYIFKNAIIYRVRVNQSGSIDNPTQVQSIGN